MKNSTPYDVVTENATRPFLVFETAAGSLALPWHDLKTILLAPDESQLVLEYSRHSAKVTGSGLGALADLAYAFRLKAIRQGESCEVRIGSVRIIGEEME